MAAHTWYLVHSKPQREETAAIHLGRQGFEVFLPRMRTQVRRGARYRERVEAMFPRYLFIHMPADGADLAPIRSTIGVSTLVRFGQQPAIVPESLVEELRQRADETGIVCDLVPAELEPGCAVRVIEGLLEGYRGIVSAKNGTERVDILLDLIGKTATATLKAHQVARA